MTLNTGTRSIFLSLLIVLGSCNDAPSNQEAQLKDLNLFLTSEGQVDSIFVSNITQDREFQFLPYSDTMHIAFNDSINDLYNLTFYADGKKMMNQLWLDGEQITIKGHISSRLEIDTIIGSELYYLSLDFRQRYRKMVDEATDDTAIDDFLMAELQKNIGNPYSIEIANNFFQRNISSKQELQKLYDLQSGQIEQIRNHLINPFRKIEKILTVTQIDLSSFEFLDVQGMPVQLKLSQGRNLLIDFWFVGCAPCIEDHKYILGNSEFLDAGRVDLVGISIDRDHKKWSDHLSKGEYPWQNFREVDKHDLRLTRDLLITTFPTYLLLDDQGNVLYRSNAIRDVEKHLTNNES